MTNVKSHSLAAINYEWFLIQVVIVLYFVQMLTDYISYGKV